MEVERVPFEGKGVTVRTERVNEGPQQSSTPHQSGKEQQQPPANNGSSQDVEGEVPKSQTKGVDPPTRCDKCGNLGPLANHLRGSATCLQAFRAYPEFKLGGNDEEFITKVCLLIKECPVPNCPKPRGSHHQLPTKCLNWWKNAGWKMMNWRGVDGSSSGSAIKAKIRMFRKNHFRRQEASSQPSQGVNTGGDQGFADEGAHNSRNSQGSKRHLEKYGLNTKHQGCIKCSNISSHLGAHLKESEDCLHAYQRKYFPGKSDAVSQRRVLLDLSLLLHFCPNPCCLMKEDGASPVDHMDGLCSQFIIDEVVAVYGWKRDVDRARLKGSLKRKATYLQQVSRQQQSESVGASMFQQELSTVLKMTCHTCFIQGPLLDAKDHKLVECVGSSPVLWQCKKCNETQGDRQNILMDIVRNMKSQGGSTHESSLKPVRIDDENGQQESIVFMPACLADNLTQAKQLAIFDPPPTTVLVPKHPDSTDVFDDETIDNAFKERKELKEISEFITKRIFLDKNPTTALSLLFRKKLADIRQERITLLKSMQLSSKGRVLSRNPNLGNIKTRNPHYAATKSLSLTSTCIWSEGHLQQRADESAAISCVNGQVKTRVKIGVLKNLAVGSPELAAVMNQLAEYHFEGRGVAVLSVAPVVLQFAKAKVGLLMKVVISKHYENWDLHADFKKDEWSLDLVGFLYSSEYGEINKKIAKEGASLSEIVEAVTKKPELQPTASLDTERIVEHYGMSAEEAEVMKPKTIIRLQLNWRNYFSFFQEIVSLARQHQQGGSLQPLSMVSMFTPKAVVGTSEEMFFRRRAMELSEELGSEVIWEDAVVNVVCQLVREGLCIRISDINEDLAKLISDQISREYGRDADRTTLIIIYHYLIWRTAGEQTWTLPRNIGEQRVIPYPPRLLQVMKMTVTAETCIYGESLSFKEPSLRQDVAKLLEDSDSWKEVSLLEFVNGCMSEDSRLVGPRSQPIVQVITQKERTLTWRDAQDNDHQKGEEVFQDDEDGEPRNYYVRTEGDVRKLFEHRPAAMDHMPLGQLASEYRKIQAGGFGLESAREKIDLDVGVGPASLRQVVGTENQMAPICMKLTNGTMMQMRSGQKAILHLLYSGAPGRHGNQLLWSPWRHLEDITGDQQDEESDLQKRRRLQVYPMSVYPSLTTNIEP